MMMRMSICLLVVYNLTKRKGLILQWLLDACILVGVEVVIVIMYIVVKWMKWMNRKSTGLWLLVCFVVLCCAMKYNVNECKWRGFYIHERPYHIIKCKEIFLLECLLTYIKEISLFPFTQIPFKKMLSFVLNGCSWGDDDTIRVDGCPSHSRKITESTKKRAKRNAGFLKENIFLWQSSMHPLEPYHFPFNIVYYKKFCF